MIGERSKANHLLSTALKLLTAYNQLGAEADAAVWATPGYANHLLPLSRTLSAIAQSYSYSAQAVTAEGLFRSSLEKLTTPYLAHDSRCVSILVLAFCS